MAAVTLIIGNYNYSTWSMRPGVFLEAFGVEHTIIQESLRAEGLRERLLRHSPTARVPVLLDSGTTVWDSLAICDYVSDLYLEGNGWPRDRAAGAYARSVAAEMHSGFSALRAEMPMNIRAKRTITPSAAALLDVARIDAVWSEGRAQFAALGDWLAGEFSIADCMYAPVAMRFATYGIRLSDGAEDYAERLRQHPAVQKWIENALKGSEIIDEDEAGEPA